MVLVKVFEKEEERKRACAAGQELSSPIGDLDLEHFLQPRLPPGTKAQRISPCNDINLDTSSFRMPLY